MFKEKDQSHKLTFEHLFPASLVLYIRFCLIDLILNVPTTVFQVNRDRSSWDEPVLS